MLVQMGKVLPGDCQHCAIAHGFGFLILAGRLNDNLAKDKECTWIRFVGAFLVPVEEVRRRWAASIPRSSLASYFCSSSNGDLAGPG